MANVAGSTTGQVCQGQKVELMNDAYSKMRVSGLTVNPSAEDLELSLSRLENIMSELIEARGVCIPYNFESEPDPNSVSNVPNWAKDAISWFLAIRLVPDFNKPVPPAMMASSGASMSAMCGRAARDRLRRVEYPNRMPIGSGNTYSGRYRWRNFYRQSDLPPNDCSTIQLKVGETTNLTETFCQELSQSESIIDFLLEPSAGLTLDNEVLVGSDIDYTVSAIDTSINSIWQTVKFTVTTDEGRVIIRVVNFELSEPQEVA